jgi:hypothetical protein
MTMKKLARVRTLYALEQLPRAMRSELLADASIVERFALSVHAPISLHARTVERDVLFSAFADLADGKPPSPLTDTKGMPLDVQLSFDGDDAGIAEIGGQRLRFPHFALLASDPQRRARALRRALVRNTLSASCAAELASIFSTSSLTHDDFIKGAGILGSSPETFVQIFRETLQHRQGQLGEADVLPEDARYWENLVPHPRTSANLDTFLAQEVTQTRRASVANDPIRGFAVLSLSFCAPKLVPSAWLSEFADDTLVAMIEGVTRFHDPIALIGSFELCAALHDRDPRYAALGDKLLDRLFADLEWLRRAAGVWATAFLLATAALTRSDATRGQPPFWRRLAAASHASLVVRACGVDDDVDANGLLLWGVRQRGAEYQLSILRDMGTEPRWRPEWADPRILVADIFGRASGAVYRMPDGQSPKSWKERVEKGRTWIDEQKLGIFTMFPAVLEGARPTTPPSLATLDPTLAALLQQFIDDPTLDRLLPAGRAAQAFGAPPEIGPALLKIVNAIRSGEESLDNQRVHTALGMCAHLACLLQDTALADALLQCCLAKTRTITHPQTVHEALFCVVEAANAHPDRAAGQTFLVQGCEALARILPANQLLLELASLLESLLAVEPSLAPLLGRAINTASVAAPR